jgi:hypothetical protein
MKNKVVVISILMLLGSLKSFSQNSSVRGKCIADNSNVELIYVNVGFYTNSCKRCSTTANMDGSFELEIGDEAGDIVISFFNCYAIKILNIPSGFKQIDLGEIKMVDSFYRHLFNMDGSLAYVDKETIDEHNHLRKETLEKYRFRVLNKELKPHFSGDNLVFDFNKGSCLKLNNEQKVDFKLNYIKRLSDVQ